MCIDTVTNENKKKDVSDRNELKIKDIQESNKVITCGLKSVSDLKNNNNYKKVRNNKNEK